ncbi:hypothetical protein MHK_008473 [Candidatus Magnetomorum sp. HK-1]|nr:hypothetical protein MHK_008473 [Candidatus Magnetomorum sp. HK-1]
MKISNEIENNHGPSMIELYSQKISFDNFPINDLDGIILKHMNENAYVVAWLDYKVLIGKRNNGQFLFYENEKINYKYIRRMRIFNAEKELHIQRTNYAFKARLRIDDLTGKGTWAVMANQVLFGTKNIDSKDENFSIITEDRGTTLTLPLANFEVNDSKQRAFLKTFNYIGYNSICQDNSFCQATYVDCRFVDLPTMTLR